MLRTRQGYIQMGESFSNLEYSIFVTIYILLASLHDKIRRIKYHSQNSFQIQSISRRKEQYRFPQHNTYIHDCSLSWLATGISIKKSYGAKLVLWHENIPSPLIKMMWSCNFFFRWLTSSADIHNFKVKPDITAKNG